MVWIATVLLMLVLLMYERPHDGFKFKYIIWLHVAT